MTFKYLSKMYIYLNKYNRKNADVLGYWSVHLEKNKTIWLSMLVFYYTNEFGYFSEADK